MKVRRTIPCALRGLVTAVLMGGLLTACGGATGTVRPHLVRLTSSAPDGAAPEAQDPAPPLPTPTQTPLEAGSDLTLDSLEIPIRAIELLGDDDASAEIYYCGADSAEGCLVNLAGAADTDLLGGEAVEVEAGAYSQLVVHTCFDEGEYSASVKGSAFIGESDLYMTKSDGIPTSSGEVETTSIDVSQCRYTFDLPSTLEVGEGENKDLKLYLDSRNLAWLGLKSAVDADPTPAIWSSLGCSGNDGGSYNSSFDAFVCFGFPIFHISTGTAPILERYRINNRAVLGLYFESADYADGVKTPVGGYLRRYYGSENPGGEAFGFDVPLRSVSKNNDGTYSIASAGASAASASYFATEDFPGDLNFTDKNTENGTFTGALSGSSSNAYLAVRLE